MSESECRTFAEKLSHLMATVHPQDRGPYSYREIAAGMHEHEGAMTAAYVQQLATGRYVNPRMLYVEALAMFFGVPPAYFFDDATTERINTQLAELVRWRDTEAAGTAERIMSLDAGDRASLLEQLEAYEQKTRAGRQRRKPTSGER